jgi:hypothetical protein
LMSNFYTEYELPIITVRTRFFPRKTMYNSQAQKEHLPSYHSLEIASKLVTSSLRDPKMTPILHR